MEALAERDERAWVRLLLIAADFPDIAQRIRALSPFAGKVLMLADYGLGFVHFRGDFESAVAEKVLAAGGVPYAGEDYVIVLSKEAFAEARSEEHTSELQSQM